MARQGKINLYERGALASGAVGTPMVADPSDELTAIGQRKEQAASAYLKLELAKREVADNIAAEKYKIQWENEYFRDLEQRKQENMEDPYTLADQAFDIGNQSASAFGDDRIKNSRVRDIFNQKVNSSLSLAQGKVRDWASKQTVDNAFKDVSDSLSELYKQAGGMKNAQEFEMLKNQGDTLVLNSVPIIGTDAAEKLRESMRRQMGENYIYAKIDNDPGKVIRDVKSGMFDGIFDELEQHNVINSAEAIIKRNQQEAEAASAAKAGYDMGKMYDAMDRGELTLYQINEMIDREKTRGGTGKSKRLATLIQARGVLINSGKYPNASMSQPEAIQAVNNAFNRVSAIERDKKEVGGKKVKDPWIDYSLKGASIDELKKMQDILDSNAPFLSTSVRALNYEKMDQLWADVLQGNKYYQPSIKNSNPHIRDYNLGLDFIYKYIDTKVPEGKRNQMKVAVSERYSQDFSSYASQKGYALNKVIRYWYDQIDNQTGMRW